MFAYMVLKKFLLSFLILIIVVSIANAEQVNTTETRIVGVAKSGEQYVGIIANLTVQVKPGTGHVFMDTLPLTQIDTQASARLAKEVACETLSFDCNNYDFFYIIRSNSPTIGGPSAGLALTLATMASLQGVPMYKDVYATGTINPAGSIGPIGTVYEKAEISYDNGAKVFLIPSGQSLVLVNETEINVTRKALDDWDMQVIEVSDILVAYKYATGYQILPVIVSTEEIASQRYDNAMKLLSESLLNDANKEYTEVEQKIGTSTLPFKSLEPIEEKFSSSESTLSDAESYYNGGQYYSASSFAVRSLINTGYVRLLLGYYDANQTEYYVTGQLNRVESDVSSFESIFLKDRKVDSIDDIETFAVVIDRLRESEDILNDSKAAVEKKDYDLALYLVSYAEVRKNTAYYWLTLINEFKGNESFMFKQSSMKTLAQERIEEVSNYITYANTVTDNTILNSSENHLNKAITAYMNEKYVFAIFEATKARAEANLAMELRAATNKTVDDLISLYYDSTRLSIKTAEQQGLLPILALSYLEYSKTFEETDPLLTLVYLSYAKEMSKISADLVRAAIGDQLLPNQGIIITKYYESIVRFNPQAELTQQFFLLIVGVLVGVLASFLIVEKNLIKR